MFLTKEDLGSSIYDYQIDQITEGDEGIVDQALAAAEEEIRGYLSGRLWSDGRIYYDVEKIIIATDSARNALLVRQAATIAKWYIVDLCNADVIYEHAKDRYDRAVAWLKQLSKSEISLSTLPRTPEILVDENGNVDTSLTDPFIYGSRAKFNHE